MSAAARVSKQSKNAATTKTALGQGTGVESGQLCALSGQTELSRMIVVNIATTGASFKAIVIRDPAATQAGPYQRPSKTR